MTGPAQQNDEEHRIIFTRSILDRLRLGIPRNPLPSSFVMQIANTTLTSMVLTEAEMRNVITPGHTHEDLDTMFRLLQRMASIEELRRLSNDANIDSSDSDDEIPALEQSL